jgi:uncharacterized membrane protein YbhN (UPF0104 family)
LRFVSKDKFPAIGHRVARSALWLAGIALAIFVLELLGVPVRDWISSLVHKIGRVPPGAIVAGAVLETLQTVFAALVWLAILRAAFPSARVPFRVVLAAYAAAVALNDFLPANIGTLVMLVMLTTVIAEATFAALLSGFVVEKIPFSVFNIALYLYLFLSVSGSFSIKLSFLSDHTALVALIAAGAVVVVVLLARILWSRTAKLRAQLAAGGAVLRDRRRAVVRLGVPALGSYLARLGIIAVFLGAYGIPVTFHNVASVSASNSVSNTVAVTPGGVGVNQAMNTAVLTNSTDAATATAYSTAQQLIVSAWDVVLAVVLLAWVFGWSGGRELVRSSYDEAKAKSVELKQQRRARRIPGEHHP